MFVLLDGLRYLFWYGRQAEAVRLGFQEEYIVSGKIGRACSVSDALAVMHLISSMKFASHRR